MNTIGAGGKPPEPPEWMMWIVSLYIHISIALFSMWWVTELLKWMTG